MRTLIQLGKHYKATFTPCTRPERDPDFISRNEWGHVSSKYWYEDNGCYRESDHWGKVGKSIFIYNGTYITPATEGSFAIKNTVTGFCRKAGFKINRKYYFKEAYFNKDLNIHKTRSKRNVFENVVGRIKIRRRYLQTLENNRNLLLLTAKEVFDEILRVSEIDIHELYRSKISEIAHRIQSSKLSEIYSGLLKANSNKYLSRATRSYRRETNFQRLENIIDSCYYNY